MPLLETDKLAPIIEELVHATNENRFIWHIEGGGRRLNLDGAEVYLVIDDAFHVYSRGGWEMGRLTVEDHGGAFVPMLRDAVERRANRFLRELCKQIEKL